MTKVDMKHFEICVPDKDCTFWKYAYFCSATYVQPSSIRTIIFVLPWNKFCRMLSWLLHFILFSTKNSSQYNLNPPESLDIGNRVNKRQIQPDEVLWRSAGGKSWSFYPECNPHSNASPLLLNHREALISWKSIIWYLLNSFLTYCHEMTANDPTKYPSSRRTTIYI